MAQPEGTNGWHPAEKLTPMEALRGFTLDAAFAAFQENEVFHPRCFMQLVVSQVLTETGSTLQVGSITPGKYADYAVFDRDFLHNAALGSVGERAILEAKCVATVIDGIVAYGAL